jgi:endonuclease YncB( thermonuclease family)
MTHQIEFQLIHVLVTLIGTAAALLLAGYFTLRRRLVLATVCLGCFFALLTPSVVYGGELCKPTRYADGDTFTYFDPASGGPRNVRVKGFDAPERTQPFSRQATNKLRELTEIGADCECHKLDRYGRSVCTVRTLAGENVATAMLRAGFGCIDPRFEKESTAQDRDEGRAALAEAQGARRGMWVEANPVCGFDYRREKRDSK